MTIRPHYIQLMLDHQTEMKTIRHVREIIDATYDSGICKSCFDGEKLYVRGWRKLWSHYDFIKCNMDIMMELWRKENEISRTRFQNFKFVVKI